MTECKVSISNHELQKESKIFGKDVDRTLSEYEDKVNAASLFLCQENISLLKNGKKLFELAKQKVDADGYAYKRKKSRSKVFGASQKITESDVRRVNVMKEVRQQRMVDLREDIDSCKQTTSLLEQQRVKFVSAEKFIQAADIVEQIKNKRKKMRELELELGKYEKSEARSAKYHKQKQKQRKFIASSKKQPESMFSPTIPGIFVNTSAKEAIKEPQELPISSVSAPSVSLAAKDNLVSSNGPLSSTNDSLSYSQNPLMCSENTDRPVLVQINPDSPKGANSSDQDTSKPQQSFCQTPQ